MKKFTVILMALYSLATQAVETDKAAHFGVAYALTISSYGLLKVMGMPPPCAALMATGVGILTTLVKEAGDQHRRNASQFDAADIAAGALGTAAATISIAVFDF